MNELPDFIGRFPVSKILGIGGMGVVYLAEDPDIGRKVAIKVLHSSGEASALDRFKNEARTIGELSHPNIVMLLEYGVEEKQPYLVMEYLEGQSLEEWIKKPHTLAEHKEVLLGLCRALSFAHEKKILHRDIKLGNVQVLRSGISKLLDFGIARSQDGNLTATGFFIGTPKYLAPEILNGSSHNETSDCYSLGLLAFSMLCNFDPFSAPTFEGVIARKLTRTPPELHTLNSSIPTALSLMIAQYLEKRADTRPDTPQKLAQALNGITSSRILNQQIEYSKIIPDTTDKITVISAKNKSGKRRYSFYFWLIPISLIAIYFYVDFEPDKKTILKEMVIKESEKEKIKFLPEEQNVENNSEVNEHPIKELDVRSQTLPNVKESPEKEGEIIMLPIKKNEPVPPKLKIKKSEDIQPNLGREAKHTNSDAKNAKNAKKAKNAKNAKNKVVDDIDLESESVSRKKMVEKKPQPLKLIFPPIRQNKNKILVSTTSGTDLSRGKSTKLKITSSHSLDEIEFKVYRGRNLFSQIRLLNFVRLKNNQFELQLYVEPNTKLGNYSLVGFVQGKKTTPIMLQVTL